MADLTRIAKDLALAQEICTKIRAENDKAIFELHADYNPVFLKMARRYAFESIDPDDLASSFWIELSDGKTICRYEARNNASLLSYLCNALYFFIVSKNRVAAREIPVDPDVISEINPALPTGRKRKTTQRTSDNLTEPEPPAEAQEESLDMIEKSALQKTDALEDLPPCSGNETKPYDNPLQDDAEERERRRLLAKFYREALETLRAVRPEDAELIELRLKGYQWQLIAEKYGATTGNDVNRLANSLKKQYTRPGSGILARFKTILNRLLLREGLCLRFEEGVPLLEDLHVSGQQRQLCTELVNTALDRLSRQDPLAALAVRNRISHLAFPELASLFGSPRLNIHTSLDMSAFQDILDTLLDETKLEMTVLGGVPIIRSSAVVTFPKKRTTKKKGKK